MTAILGEEEDDVVADMALVLVEQKDNNAVE
jgi:hypothetical protein